MALTFPSNPTLNQVYSTGSLSWTWNGKSWNNGTSILATSNLVSSSVQFTNGNTTAFDTNSNITVGQITASFAKISGSIFGTASFATNAFSASYAPNIYVLPSNVVSASAQLSNNGGVAFDTTSNITVGQITASFAKITNLTVQYVTSSVMVITGSNKFGDASNDTQEFTGSVNMSGSLSIVGNVTSNNVLSLSSGTVALPSLILSTDTTSGMYRIGANNIGISISAAKVLDISSTGLSVTGTLSASGGYNGTVGATTPSTVAATTISASATSNTPITMVTTNAISQLSLDTTAGGATDATQIAFRRNGTSKWTVGNNVVNTGDAFTIASGGVSYASVSSTGLAVTGAVSSTTKLTAGTLFAQTPGVAGSFSCATPTFASGQGTVSIGSTDSVAVDKGGIITFNANTTTLSGFPVAAIAGKTEAVGAGVYSGYLQFVVSNPAGITAERMRIDSSGNVGIGTTSPAAKLDVAGTINSTGLATIASSAFITGRSIPSSGAGLEIFYSSNLSYLISYDRTNNAHKALSIGGTPVTIDISGSTVATVSSTGLAVTGAITASTSMTVNSATGITVQGFQFANADSSGNRAWFGDVSHTNVGLRILSNNTTNVQITGETFAGVDKPIAFDGNAAGCSFGGNLSVGGATSSTARLQVTSDGSNYTSCFQTSTTGQYGQIAFRNPNGVVGGIDTSGSSVVYNTSSDYRLKNITGPITDSGTFIDALKPKVGTWKVDGSKFVGFIAHEFAEVSPSSVSGEKDAVDSDGNPKYQAMQASSSEVIANLVAELQSVRARLAALEAK